MAAWRAPSISGYFKECQKIASCCENKGVLGRSETIETRGGANVVVTGIFGGLLGFAVVGAAFLSLFRLISAFSPQNNIFFAFSPFFASRRKPSLA